MESYTAGLPLSWTDLYTLGPWKETKLKTPLRVATLSPDGLLFAKNNVPFTLTCSLIIVPRYALACLLSALHFKLEHPSKAQLSALCHEYFFGMDELISAINCHCPQWAAIASLPPDLRSLHHLLAIRHSVCL